MNSVRRKRTARRGPKKRNIFLCFFLVCLAALFGAVSALNLYLLSLKPISNLEDIKPNPVTTIYSADGEVIKTFTAFKFEKVSIDKIPEYLKQAIIATEDKNFYKHPGYDIVGLARSMVANILAGRVVQGLCWCGSRKAVG